MGPQDRVRVAGTRNAVALGTDETATRMHANIMHDAHTLHDHMTAGGRIAHDNGHTIRIEADSCTCRDQLIYAGTNLSYAQTWLGVTGQLM